MIWLLLFVLFGLSLCSGLDCLVRFIGGGRLAWFAPCGCFGDLLAGFGLLYLLCCWLGLLCVGLLICWLRFVLIPYFLAWVLLLLRCAIVFDSLGFV